MIEIMYGQYRIRDEIKKAIEGTSIKVEKLKSEECEEIREKIIALYCKNSFNNSHIWENFQEYHFISNENAWRYLKGFVQNRECILFYNECDEKMMFRIKSGRDLEYIIEETFGDDVYVTDEECSYLLCFNDHDILYGCGSASVWIEKLKQ